MGVEPLGRRQEGANLRVELEVPQRQGREAVCEKTGQEGKSPQPQDVGTEEEGYGRVPVKVAV